MIMIDRNKLKAAARFAATDPKDARLTLHGVLVEASPAGPKLEEVPTPYPACAKCIALHTLRLAASSRLAAVWPAPPCRAPSPPAAPGSGLAPSALSLSSPVPEGAPERTAGRKTPLRT